MTDLTIPKCPKCGETFSVVVGLPVTVTFAADGVATVATDLAELPDFSPEDVACVCAEQRAISDEDYAALIALGERVRDRAAPSLDVDL